MLDEVRAIAALSRFIGEFCHEAPGHLIEFKQFRAIFIASLPIDERNQWTNYRLSRALRKLGIAVGARTGNRTHIANLFWIPVAPLPFRYERKGNYLFARETT